jgi:Na+/melibiose symporter-like transporter
MITLVAAVTAGTVVTVVGVLLAQPSSEWRDAAEHTRRFWIAWAIAGCVIAAAGPPLLGAGVEGAVWLAGFAGVGVLQPAMIADVVDVRGLVRRRRWVATLPVASVQPALAPIRWRAADVSDHGRSRNRAAVRV